MATKQDLYQNKLFTLDTLLTPLECKQIIDTANLKGWNESSPSGGGHGRTGNEDARDNQFTVFYDAHLSQKLMDKVRTHLPDNLAFLAPNVYFNSQTQGTEWSPAFVYDKFRVYKYNVGTAFPEHLDYKVTRRIFRNNDEYVQQSFLSLLVYLNDDFEGGITGYWPDHNGVHCRFLRNVERQCSVKDHQVAITPKTGLGVVQDQNILHEGTPTTKGVKYILRTDIIHERKVPHNPKIQKENKDGDWERLFETSCKNYAD
jgi:prolyl 4-hydroxylase